MFCYCLSFIKFSNPFFYFDKQKQYVFIWILISILGITIPSRHRTGGYAKLAISLENSTCDNSKSTEIQPEVCEKSTETTPSLCQYDLEDLEDDDEEFFYPDEINYYGEDDDTSSYYGEYNLQNHG